MTQLERQILQLIEANPMISQRELAKKLNLAPAEVGECISGLTRSGSITGRGFVLNESYAVVAGGVNVDIGGHSFAPLVASDSNPGRVSVSLGGVGRNIAHNLALLGPDVRLLCAYGDDLNGQRVAASCSQLGIDLSHALKIPGGTTSTYLYLTDETGEMALAVSDMEICKQVTPEYLEKQLPLIRGAQVLVIDANLSEEAIAYLAENAGVPLFVDPVSTVKAEKLRPILHKIHTLKPNRLEAGLLAGVEIKTLADVETAADKLIEMGVHRMFISLGADGVYAAMGRQRLWLPNLPGRMVNTTGCGDAFMAALVWSYLVGMDLRSTALAGLAAGSIAMESAETINPNMSAEEIRRRMGL